MLIKKSGIIKKGMGFTNVAALSSVSSAGGGGVAFDQSSQGAWSNVGTTPQTWNHIPIGTPTGIIIGIVNFRANNLPTAVTYNGISLGAAAVSQINVFGAASGFAAIFGLASPPSGTQQVSITLVGASGNFGFAFAMSVTGSDLATIFRNNNPATATNTSISNTCNSAAGDLVVDFVNANTGTDTVSSPGAGQASTTITGRTDAKFSYKTAAGASETMTWTLSPSDTWWSNAVSVQHA